MSAELFHIESEQSVLGGLLIDPNAFDRIDFLAESDFYREDHRIIFRHIALMLSERKPVDVVTVAESLVSAGDNEVGLAYLGELQANTPSAANIKRYAEVVSEKRALRDLLEASSQIAEVATNDSASPASQRIDEAQAIVFALAERRAQSGNEDAEIVGSILVGVVADIHERFDRGGQITGLPTGFADLDEKTCGLQGGDLVIVAGRPSMGKELTLDSKVLLSSGMFKRMGDMMIGDSVASVDGSESRVTGVFPQGVKPVYRVAFSDGRSVDAGLDHQFEVMCKHWTDKRVLTVADLSDLLKKQRYKSRLYIPNHSGDFGVDVDMPIAPYLLGALIGDGGMSGGSLKITTSYPHILEKITPMLDGAELRLSVGISYRISTDKGQPNNIHAAIKSLGLLGKLSQEKFIPPQYLSASKESRLELMRGLIDTDGTVEKTGAMTYTTTSESLATDVQFLARSLGAFASMSDRTTQYTYLGEKKTGQRAYTIYISCESYGDFVTIPHKKNRIKSKSRVRRLNIESITRIGDDECQCISVSHPRSLYIADDFTVTHNTAFAINVAEHVAVKEGKPALVFSMEMNKKQLTERSIASLGALPMQSIRSGQNIDFDKMSFAVGQLYKAPLHIDDTAALTVMQMRSRARRLARKNGLSLIVVDYIQLARGDSASTKNGNREQEVSSISRGLKALAKEFNCPVIALSQLNRKVDDRADKRPMMSDLRDSGAIEQDADIILMMYRDDYYNKNSPEQGIAEIIIGKQRMGETGTVKVLFQGEFSRFKNLSSEAKANLAQTAEEARQANQSSRPYSKRGMQ